MQKLGVGPHHGGQGYADAIKFLASSPGFLIFSTYNNVTLQSLDYNIL